MHRLKAIRLALALLTILGITAAACSAPSGQTGTLEVETRGPSTPAESAEVVAQVVADLAGRLNVASDEILVTEVTPIEWLDTDLGCSGSGESYDQVTIPGYEIQLQAESSTYTYHSGPDDFVLCDDEASGGSTPTAGLLPSAEEADGALEVLLGLAREDLSTRLGIPAQAIAVGSIEAVDWDDSSLGCRQPGMSYLSVITPGYLIVLSAESQTYEYHSDGEQVLLCAPTDSDEPAQDWMGSSLRSHLAQMLGLNEDEIEVVSVEPAEWPDSSLGCPKPGMSYLQVITPGARVVLEALGQKYTYHTGPHSFVLCEDAGTSAPVLGEGRTDVLISDPEVDRLVTLAMENLSQRLGIARDEIGLHSVENVLWRDSSLGCPEHGMAYLTVITPGYLILLAVDDEMYEYHADTARVIYCQDPHRPLEGP